MTTASRSPLAAWSAAGGLLVLGIVIGVLADPLIRVHASGSPTQPVSTWAARGVLLLAVAWVVIGILAARTRLVERPGAAAARATWIASTRPWRARESVLGVLAFDRLLMIVVPVAVLIGTRVIEASFAAWLEVGGVLAGWVVFALVVRLLVGRRSPWPVIAAMGGCIILYGVIGLVPFVFAGPDAVWTALAASRVLRISAVAIAFAVAAWLPVASGWALVEQFGVRRAVGIILAGVGAGVAVAAALLSGTAHGPAAPLDLPAPTPWIAVAVGLLVAASGLGIALARTRRD